jgi:hypothetical protein
LLSADWLLAASRARTKYSTVTLSGWLSVNDRTLPATVVIGVLSR